MAQGVAANLLPENRARRIDALRQQIAALPDGKRRRFVENQLATALANEPALQARYEKLQAAVDARGGHAKDYSTLPAQSFPSAATNPYDVNLKDALHADKLTFEAAAAGLGIGLVSGGIAGLAIGGRGRSRSGRHRRKASRSSHGKRRGRRRGSKRHGKRSSRGRAATPRGRGGTARQYRRPGGGRVHYTKNGQPYILLRSGKARFVRGRRRK